MSDVAQYAVRDGIAVITMNNPPVNGLGNALRAALQKNFERADHDGSVKAVVLIGSALDKWLGTKSLMLVGIILGSVAGFVELIRVMMKASRE